MKTAILGPADTFQSGISTFSDRLADAFARAGHETWFVPIRRLVPRALFPGRGRVRKDPAPRQRRYRFGPTLDYDSPLGVMAARRFAREQRFDALVVAWWTSAAAHMTLPVARAARRAGATVLLDIHEVRDPIEDGKPMVRAYARWAFRRALATADLAVVHAGSEAVRAKAEAPSQAAKIHKLPHPAYDHYGPAMPRDEARRRLDLNGGFVILSFGLARRYKGLPELVQALDHLPPDLQSDAQLLIVGELWGARRELEAAVAASPHRDRIRVVDQYVPDDEVRTYFSAADVVALPYRRSAQSGVLQVAKNFGTPVVVSEQGGLPEAVEDYPRKALCKPGDPASLAAALARAKQAPPIRGYRPYAWDDAVRDLTALVDQHRARR